MNKRLNKFSPEVRERAMRMVQEHHGEYPSLGAAIQSITPRSAAYPKRSTIGSNAMKWIPVSARA
jgi:transposase